MTTSLDHLANAPYGGLLKVVHTDVLTAKYAVLPITSTSLEFMVEILEPLHMVHVKLSVNYFFASTKQKDDGYHLIEEAVLDHWRNLILASQGNTVEPATKWLLDINKVRLIECDLLTPKNTANAVSEITCLPAPEWMKVLIKHPWPEGKDITGWISKDTWHVIQETLAGRGPQQVYQFNMAGDFGSPTDYCRVCVGRPPMQNPTFEVLG